MTVNFPSATTVHFITKILSAGGVSVADVASTIGRIDSTLKNLAAPESAVASAPAPLLKLAEQPAEAAPKRRRGRPPRQVALQTAIDDEVLESAVAPEPPAQPKLLRRAEAMGAEQDPFANFSAKLQAREPTATDKLHGVVKWYDSRSGKGALRLAGISGDIALDAGVMAKAGIKRLYKDQEIEATILRGKGQPQLVTLSLPGRETAAPALGGGGEIVAMTRGHNRPVTVEIKSDTSKQRQNRARAERLFGTGTPKKAGTPA